MPIGLSLFLVVVFLAMNAFFVIAEFAMVRVRPSQIEMAVEAGKPGAVNAEHGVQAFQRHVMDEHVVAALQERGVDRKNRYHALRGKPGAHRHAVTLRNCHVKEAFRERFGKV